MANEVYSICFMCTVRCPIRVLVENDDVKWIEGNPHVPGIEGALCAKGSAGLALLHDDERPQHPMIRTGPRGVRGMAAGHLERSPGLRRRQTQGDHQAARRPERGLRGAHQSQYPHQQDLHEGHRLPEPFHPRRPVQRLAEHRLSEPHGLYRRPGGGGLRQYQVHRHVRPQPLRSPWRSRPSTTC